MHEQELYTAFQEPLRHAVHQWLKERQDLLVQMCGIQPESPLSDTDVPTAMRLQSFCQVLMDYVSAAHFEIFNTLIAEAEQTGTTEQVAQIKKLYTRLQTSTDLALRFNDLYDSEESLEELQDQLKQELSELGLALEARFRLEDEILSLLNQAISVETA